MNEIVIREALVFGGAVAGALWGYYLGKVVERRRFALEVSATLETFERWAVDVCRGLEGLERSLALTGFVSVSDARVGALADARAVLHDAKVRMPSLKPADEIALQRFVSRVTNRA